MSDQPTNSTEILSSVYKVIETASVETANRYLEDEFYILLGVAPRVATTGADADPLAPPFVYSIGCTDKPF